MSRKFSNAKQMIMGLRKRIHEEELKILAYKSKLGIVRRSYDEVGKKKEEVKKDEDEGNEILAELTEEIKEELAVVCMFTVLIN
jgi:hypothetical protein